MKIVMIGAGNVATHLTACSPTKKNKPSCRYTAGQKSRLRHWLNLPTVHIPATVQDINADADLYIVSVKDSVLSDLLPQIVLHQSQCLVCSHSRQCPYGYLEGTYTSIRSIIPDADIQQTTSCRFR